MPDPVELQSIQDAKEYAANNPGPFLVLSQETLAQIRAAEAAGGYEGGMSGASGAGGYSASGSAPNSSDASDPAPADTLDPGYYVPVGGFFEGLTEKIIELHEVLHALEGAPLGPIILVPNEELTRWLNGGGESA